MKNKINKEYNYSFILNTENLDKLIKFLSKYFKEIKYFIKIIDWVEIELSYKELLNYDNYDSEKIIWLKIEWTKNKEDDSYIFLHDDSIEISFGYYKYYKYLLNETINITIKSKNNKEFNEIKEGIIKILENDFKTSYNLLTNILFFNLIHIISFFLFLIYLTYNYIKILDFDKQISILLSYLLVITIIINIPLYKNIYYYFFPKFIFWIWKQKEQIKIKENSRNIFFIVIILWIIISIVSSYLYSFISK